MTQRRTEAEEAAPRLLDLIQGLLLELHPHGRPRAVTLDSSLERDLGLDSLGRMELLHQVEDAFGVRLPEQLIVTAETPRDVLRALLARTGQAPPEELKVAFLRTGPAPEAPQQAMTLTEVLTWHATTHPERVHVHLQTDPEPVELTYHDLLTGAAEVAAGLQAHGLEPGETVAIMLPTSRQYLETFFGALLAGLVPVPIYPPFRPSQLEEHLRRQAGILRNAQASVLVSVPEVRSLAHLLRATVESLRAIETVEALKSGKAQTRLHANPQDVAFLQYTSGSTGNPKGVVLTHANLLANIRAMGEVAEVGPRDVFVSWLPLYHDMGLIGAWLGSLYYGIPLVLLSPLQFLARPERWLWSIHRYGGTLSAAPNFAYEI
ncbi:MAG TPA: AMP-binding protein, partial [Stenomitos sp.]